MVFKVNLEKHVMMWIGVFWIIFFFLEIFVQMEIIESRLSILVRFSVLVSGYLKRWVKASRGTLKAR